MLCMLICFSILFISCEKDLNTEIGSFNPKLGVISIFTPDSVWQASVFSTTSILESLEVPNVENAIVRITDEKTNIVFQLNHVGEGVYVNELRKPAPDRSYSLEVLAPGFETVYARSSVPSEVVNVDSEISEVLHPDGSKSYQIDFEIEDNPLEENFYVWELERQVKSKIQYDDPGTYHQVISSGNDPNNGGQQANYGKLSTSKDYGDVTFLDDSNFDNPDNKSKSTLEELFPINASEITTFVLKVKAVTHDLYNYLQTLDKYHKNPKNNSSQYHTYVYSNIENGTGIFGGYREEQITLVK